MLLVCDVATYTGKNYVIWWKKIIKFVKTTTELFYLLPLTPLWCTFWCVPKVAAWGALVVVRGHTLLSQEEVFFFFFSNRSLKGVSGAGGLEEVLWEADVDEGTNI